MLRIPGFRPLAVVAVGLSYALVTGPALADPPSLSASFEETLYRAHGDDEYAVREVRSGQFHRDAAGRTRTALANRVVIRDPVANQILVLDPSTQTAKRVTPPAGPAGQTDPYGASTGEDLGARTVAGITCTGRRYVIPVREDSLLENPEPIVVVAEVWLAESLGLPMMVTTESETFGRKRQRFADIQLVTPDPSLFQVPPGYAIEDLP